ncbi:ornithine carbamoyltransferase [Oceanirhabdus sp. W0125-5]|uniref:ornithine carbamoyltransferase n=1 Tax=Oceanirhabdus sp. W0125-5 TaxID=2999116 RepID=UPI0022F32D60|nr:hypothetical protein [Oceanirhabdus sp. W0125-5]WBW97305.1 hypothetical protein OW730_00185 [Oceanirhabdus sp. W0125-5]
MRHLVSLRDMDRAQLDELMKFAYRVKEKQRMGEEFKPLKGKTVITSFPSTSLRTRISFETGIFQLGANAINMEINFEGKEPLEDKVGYLNCWIDYLVIRYKKEKIIREISEKAEFHVVNAMSRESHPCEILSDLMTLNEIKGRLQDQKIVFVGEGANISNTWFEAAAKLDLNLTQICPEGYEISDDLFKYARDNSNGEIVVTNDFEKGIKNADIILTDGWPPSENGESIPEIFLPYQLTLDKLKSCSKGYIVNPCPPFTRGNEVSEEIINSDRFIGYKGKENLLHMQKAILGILNFGH